MNRPSIFAEERVAEKFDFNHTGGVYIHVVANNIGVTFNR